MNIRILVVTGCFLAACGNQLPDDSTQGVKTSAQEVQDRAAEAAAQKKCGDECRSNADFGLAISGKDVPQWNGRKVVVAAHENPQTGNGSRVVLLTDRVRNGEFSVACPKSLTENYSYPTWAAYIDVDGDGKCSSDDVGFQMGFYGWNREVEDAVPSSEWTTIKKSDAYGPLLSPPLGSDAKDFCSGYFGN